MAHLICGHMHQSNVLCFVTEKGLNAIKAIYNYNKYNLIHTHRLLTASPLPTLLYPRARNNPLPCYLLCTPR